MLKLCYFSGCILHYSKEANQYHNKTSSSHWKLQDFQFPLPSLMKIGWYFEISDEQPDLNFPCLCIHQHLSLLKHEWETICIIKKRNVLKYFPHFRTKCSSAVSAEQNPAPPVWQLNNSLSVTQHTELSGMCSHIPNNWTHLNSTISNLSFFFNPAIRFLLGHKRGKEGDTTAKNFLPLWNARAKAWLKLAEN